MSDSSAQSEAKSAWTWRRLAGFVLVCVAVLAAAIILRDIYRKAAESMGRETERILEMYYFSPQKLLVAGRFSELPTIAEIEKEIPVLERRTSKDPGVVRNVLAAAVEKSHIARFVGYDDNEVAAVRARLEAHLAESQEHVVMVLRIEMPSGEGLCAFIDDRLWWFTAGLGFLVRKEMDNLTIVDDGEGNTGPE